MKSIAGYPAFNANKYHNKRQTCRSGHSHGSIGEANYCDYLANQVAFKHIRSYESQVSYPLTINGITVCSHIVDFAVIDKDGKKSVHEFKGLETDIWKLKKKMFEAIYPDIPYHVIKYQWFKAKTWNTRFKARRKKNV